jgi:hypothetical protein
MVVLPSPVLCYTKSPGSAICMHALKNTTGNEDFAEGQNLCQVQKIGHSAKSNFAECNTRQSKTHGKFTLSECPALGKDYFTECRTLGKESHSANAQQDLTVVTGVSLCRVSTPGHSAKINFAERQGKTLGKINIIFFFILSKIFSITILHSP